MNFVSSQDPRFYHLQSEFANYTIDDIRSAKNFQFITICGQPVKQQHDLLFTNLLASNLPTVTVIAADLLVSFHFETKLWPCCFDFFLRHINAENAFLIPKLLNDLFVLHKTVQEECKYNAGLVRNYRQLRLDLSILLYCLCKSPLRPKPASFQFTKGYFTQSVSRKEEEDVDVGGDSDGGIVSSMCLSESARKKQQQKEERKRARELQSSKNTLIDKTNRATYNLQLVNQQLRADSSMYVDVLLDTFHISLSREARNDDDDEQDWSQLPDEEMRENIRFGEETYLSPFRIFLNEFLYSLHRHSEVRSMHYMNYWLHCMLDLHAKKVSKNEVLKRKMKKSDDFVSVFQYIFQFMGASKPPIACKKEPKDAHIIWLIWAACIQFMETHVNQQRVLNPNPSNMLLAKYTRIIMALRELCRLFYLSFPLSISDMYMFMNMLFEIIVDKDNSRIRIPCSLQEFRDFVVQDRETPNFQLLALKPYEIVLKQIEKNEQDC